MPASTTGSLLPDDDWNDLQAIADQFAAARKQGPIDDWLPFIPPRDDRKHRPVLLELVKIDLGMSWHAGTGPRVESYVERFPGLDPLPVELIVEEYRQRHLHGDKPALAEYQTRFPAIFAEIERKVIELPGKSIPASADPTVAKAGIQPVFAPPPADAQPVLPDGYKAIERIGRGNFGEVWKAEAPGGVEVAVKIVTQPLDNDGAQRELQALELVKKLQHPTLLATYAFWVVNNRLVIAMELADGSLRDRLKECKQKGLPGIPAEELATYFRDAAAGLDYLHWQKVLHRDIKPDNILLKQGYAKVADFGLARAQSGALMSTSFAGTPAFMAPEVWGGKINERSDQYSLAFTYAELRLGRRPLQGDDFMSVMKNTLECEPDLGNLPKAEQTVIRRALARKQEDRFDSCEEFVDALERAVTPDGKAGRRRPSPVQRLKRGSETGASKTERSMLADESVKKPGRSVESTQTGEESQVETRKKPGVWKPPGPTAPPSAARPILFGIVAILVLGGGAFLVWHFLLRNGGTGSSISGGTEPGPSITHTSPKTPPTPKATNPDPPIMETVEAPPPRFAKARNANAVSIGAKKYYDRIVYKLNDGSGEAAFRLLRPVELPASMPYYVMEDKVWNALFAEFQLSQPGAKKWQNDGPSLPARNVTWAEAAQFARWLGGQLPTAQQWDYAAGFWRQDGRAGPAGPAARSGIGVSKPLSISDNRDDISPLLIRAMTGNGREFTRDTFAGGDGDLVTLRGRMFTSSKPLTYADLEAEQKDSTRTQTQYRNVPSPFTGFRVVIEVPY